MDQQLASTLYTASTWVLPVLLAITLNGMGLEHPLVLYAVWPDLPYSAMNGYGHYLLAERFYLLYWSGAALMLLATLLSVRMPRSAPPAVTPATIPEQESDVEPETLR